MARVRRGVGGITGISNNRDDYDRPKMNRAEQISLEQFSLGWPWHDARNAAALACELIRWATPSQVWVDADDPILDALDKHMNAEVPKGDGDPYRTPGEMKFLADPVEVTEARFEIGNILGLVMNYVHGEPVVAPASFGEPTDHPMTRLYWYIVEAGKRAAAYGERAGQTLRSLRRDLTSEELARWYHAGCSAREACEFLRKFASGNQTVGEIDGAGGAVLHRISLHLVYAGKPTAEVTGRMFHWRVQDALKGKRLAPELEANLRPAFEAAWSSGEYQFAYSLLDDVDQLAEGP